MRQILRLGAVLLAAPLLTSCFSPVQPGGSTARTSLSPAAQSGPDRGPTASTNSTVEPAPGISASGTAASPVPSASIAAGYPTALDASAAGGRNLADRRHEMFVTAESCPATQSCIHGPAAEHDGVDAAYVAYEATGATGAGPGPYPCFVYVYHDGAGWHPYDGYCTQQISASIGGTEYIYTPGTCANIRKDAGLKTQVVDCLPHHTQVTVDEAPTWVDGHLWWHLASRGWTVHENLFPDFNSGSLTCGGGPPECWINGN